MQYIYSQLLKLSKLELINIVVNESIGAIKNAKDVNSFFHDFAGLIKNWNKEHLVVLCLNTKNSVIHAEVVTMGVLDSSLVHPREIFNVIFATPGTSSFIIAHNHPSGNPNPSDEDFSATKRIKAAADIMGINLLDHIVFTKFGEFYSFLENNNM